MWLLHGTTRRRGRAIVAKGPDPAFIEPGQEFPAENFSTCVEGWGSAIGEAEDYARSKSRLFPKERGGVVVAIDVPETIVEMAARKQRSHYAGLLIGGRNPPLLGLLASCGGVVLFDPGSALDQLLAGWGTLKKEIRGVG